MFTSTKMSNMWKLGLILVVLCVLVAVWVSRRTPRSHDDILPISTSAVADKPIQTPRQIASPDTDSALPPKAEVPSEKEVDEFIQFLDKLRNTENTENTEVMAEDAASSQDIPEYSAKQDMPGILNFISLGKLERKVQEYMIELEAIVPKIVECRSMISELRNENFSKYPGGHPVAEKRAEFDANIRGAHQELSKLRARAGELHSFLVDSDITEATGDQHCAKADEIFAPVLTQEGWSFD